MHYTIYTALYIAQCTLHTIQCTKYCITCCIMYNTLYTVLLYMYCTMHTTQCTRYTAHHTMHNVHYTLHCTNVHCTMHTAQCRLYNVLNPNEIINNIVYPHFGAKLYNYDIFQLFLTQIPCPRISVFMFVGKLNINLRSKMFNIYRLRYLSINKIFTFFQ